MTRKGRPKYHNKKVEYDGILFDSIKEKDRYIVLKQAEQDGLISELTLQPRWVLLPAKKERYIEHKKTKDVVKERTILLPMRYTADFSYSKDGEFVVEDVKGSPYTLSKDVPLRLKMMKYFHDIDVRLVYKANDVI